MRITRIDQNGATPTAQDPVRRTWFDGPVSMQRLVGQEQSGEVEVLAVFFGAGGRTRPHIHPHDQVLQIVEGRGIVATETEKHYVTVGDVITIPAGVWHWHGATRDAAMCHIATQQPGTTNWDVEEKNWAAGYNE